ncbi:MAG TPA: hypothetical protein ENK02_04285, partial [Planctomycetes bacterium]|nr:hypothetical protein [Planctomycetota bacterium]
GTRRGEAEQAFAAHGLHGRFLGLPDGRLGRVEGCGTRDLERIVAKELRRTRPGLLLGPHEGDSHPDHAVVGRVLAALDLGQVACLHWLGAEPSGRPNFFVGVVEVYEAKRAWIRFHASQLPGPGGSRGHLPRGLDLLERARAREERYGRATGLGLAEPFLAKARPERVCSLLGGCLFTGEDV